MERRGFSGQLDEILSRKYLNLLPVRRWKCQTDLEPPPDCAIEQFGVVRRGNNNDVAWQFVELHQKKGYDAFNFTSFVSISTFFADRVELVKKQNASWVRI